MRRDIVRGALTSRLSLGRPLAMPNSPQASVSDARPPRLYIVSLRPAPLTSDRTPGPTAATLPRLEQVQIEMGSVSSGKEDDATDLRVVYG